MVLLLTVIAVVRVPAFSCAVSSSQNSPGKCKGKNSPGKLYMQWVTMDSKHVLFYAPENIKQTIQRVKFCLASKDVSKPALCFER